MDQILSLQLVLFQTIFTALAGVSLFILLMMIKKIIGGILEFWIACIMMVAIYKG